MLRKPYTFAVVASVSGFYISLEEQFGLCTNAPQRKGQCFIQVFRSRKLCIGEKQKRIVLTREGNLGEYEHQLSLNHVKGEQVLSCNILWRLVTYRDASRWHHPLSAWHAQPHSTQARSTLRRGGALTRCSLTNVLRTETTGGNTSCPACRRSDQSIARAVSLPWGHAVQCQEHHTMWSLHIFMETPSSTQ